MLRQIRPRKTRCYHSGREESVSYSAVASRVSRKLSRASWVESSSPRRRRWRRVSRARAATRAALSGSALLQSAELSLQGLEVATGHRAGDGGRRVRQPLGLIEGTPSQLEIAPADGLGEPGVTCEVAGGGQQRYHPAGRQRSGQVVERSARGRNLHRLAGPGRDQTSGHLLRLRVAV